MVMVVFFKFNFEPCSSSLWFLDDNFFLKNYADVYNFLFYITQLVKGLLIVETNRAQS